MHLLSARSGVNVRFEQIGNATLYLGDCLPLLTSLGKFGAVVTDPPYPNPTGLFLDGVAASRAVIGNPPTEHVIAFWDEMDAPYCPHRLVARHAWHRTNTNRPNNYEAIYEWHADGKKRSCRVFPYAVVLPGLTGCADATGHPTQKHEKLMQALLSRTTGRILDPFMGSGSTGVAALAMDREFVGIEIDVQYFDIACERIHAAHAQQRLFA
jgi:site-specific DNA-methyltransferase (adenine-specific)